MGKMWQGRTDGQTVAIADDFNSSFAVDSRMYKEDITGSMAHAAMLGKQGIITQAEADSIIEGLAGILSDMEEAGGAYTWYLNNRDKYDEPEDIHMFVEQILTERLEDLGKKLHTARSRNDQVAVDTRLYLRNQLKEISEQLTELIEAIIELASKHQETILPGYTHLQRAQPVTYAYYLMAYVQMLLRDLGRLKDAVKRMNVSPLGSCALAGTTYDTDRAYTAEKLGFDTYCVNAMDGVSDRDYCIELLSAFSVLMMHLSRMSEEIILWSSWEFKFIELDDAYTTGSSIMPQKKNSDMAELVRGKTGRVYGDLMASLTMLKGLPLAYNKDMQEDKESIFDAVDTVKMCLPIMTGMMTTVKVNRENMKEAAGRGFINATDLADYLVLKGLPFRSAYKISGQIVSLCIKENKTLESLELEKYREFSELFDKDVYDAVDLMNCVSKRTSKGATSVEAVKEQIEASRKALESYK